MTQILLHSLLQVCSLKSVNDMRRSCHILPFPSPRFKSSGLAVFFVMLTDNAELSLTEYAGTQLPCYSLQSEEL